MRRRKTKGKGGDPASHTKGNADRDGSSIATSSKRVDFLGTGRGFAVTAILLFSARLLSSAFNILHDCDETYNYWEPLHYLLYKSGFQTWEYSPDFALRSYLYLLVHYVFALPLSKLGVLAGGSPKLPVFFGVRCLFGLASALSEGYLVHALSRTKRGAESRILLVFLMTSAAMFVSSTTFLPGTFSMYCFTLATSGVLLGRRTLVILACAVSVILGWSVTIIAAVPYALWVLVTGALLPSLLTAILSSGAMLVATFAADSYFYGRHVLSLHSFLSYNVYGSGDSALYGVENSTYYLRNGTNSLNLLLPLSLLAPVLLLVGILVGSERRANSGNFFIACSPQWLWIAAITILPHKEERFLYVVYPQILLAAAYSALVAGRACASIAKTKYKPLLRRLVVACVVIATSLLSAARVGALVSNYGASMRVYASLEGSSQGMGEGGPPCVVCVGSEWYEYPSSFFVPQRCEMHFVRSGFGGVLPGHFNSSLGGTRHASEYLNDRNQADDRQYISDESRCTFLVSMRADDHIAQEKESDKWEVVRKLKYVNSGASGALYRALFIPFLSAQKLVYNHYVLYKARSA